MKNFSLALLVLLAISSLSGGCAYFGSSEDDKNWHGVMGPERFDDHMERSLAREKLKNLPPVPGTSTINGYPGIMRNFTDENANFLFRGPEDKAFLVGPKGEERDNLIPGKYACNVWQNGELIKTHIFTVSAAQSKLLGEPTNWFIIIEPKK